jgi:hypothetical protein
MLVAKYEEEPLPAPASKKEAFKDLSLFVLKLFLLFDDVDISTMNLDYYNHEIYP